MDEEILEQWQRWFGDVPPVGYMVRDGCPERWLRIHSLPDSKRYPSIPSEEEELLRRHYAAAEDVLGEGSVISVFIPSICGIQALADQSAGAHLPFPLAVITQVPADDSTMHDETLCILGGHGHWHRRGFDRFLLAVAHDVLNQVLVLAVDTGHVFAPYDGGADLYYSNEVTRDIAGARFADWRSPREDGL